MTAIANGVFEMNEATIFDAALDIADASERAAFLDNSCAGNPKLRQHLEQLLSAQNKLGVFLDRPVSWLAATDGQNSFQEKPGTLIGPYRLIEQIGEGGFGLVFVAEQQRPVQRKVALKVIKPGMDTREVMSRFAVERQALALMDHPNIAKVLDAGTTESGRPYFVMELVGGVPITDYCNQNQLNPRQRLELFMTVCQAVQHAHQKGIIHRDIKPSNILVTADGDKPIVKVIDFGVAKAIYPHLTDRSVFTAVAQMVGTPLYMSPEQAAMSGVDVDTRSDIYSLGVLLYELLTGTTPFDKKHFAAAAYDEIRRIIREEEPEKPSTRLSRSDSLPAVAAERKTEPTKLPRVIRGDLDWITMKALEKDPARRYESASGFARDIERYLSDEPVEACPPSVEYRVRKFVRRNKWPVIAATLILLMLIGGIVGTSWGLYQAETARRNEEKERIRAEANEKTAHAERREAIRQNEFARAVTEFLKDDMLALASVEGQYEREAAYLGKEAKVRDLLDRASNKIDGRFTDQPLVEAEIRWTIGATYRKLGEPTLAIPHLEKCTAIYKAHRGPEDDFTLLAQNSLAVSYLADDQLIKAAQLLEHICNTRITKLDPKASHTLTALDNLAVVYHKSGRLREAIERFEKVRDSKIASFGLDDPRTLLTLNNLALAYEDAGRVDDAIPLLEKVRDVRVVRLGANHPFTLATVSNLASVYRIARRLPESIKLFEQTRDAQIVALGQDHPDTLLTQAKLARAYREAQQLSESIQLFEKVRDLQIAKLGVDHPDTLTTLNNLAMTYKQARRFADSIQLYNEIIAAESKKLGADHSKTLTTRSNLARAYLSAGQTADAIGTAEQLRDAATAKLGRDHSQLYHLINTLAICYEDAGRYTDALEIFNQVYEGRVATLGADHQYTLESLGKVASTLKHTGNLRESIRAYEKLRDALITKYGLNHENTLVTLTNLASAYRNAGRMKESVTTYEQLRDGHLALNGAEHEETLLAIRLLGTAYYAANQFNDAELLFRDLLATRERLDANHWRTYETMSLLGGVLIMQKKFDQSEYMLLEGIRGLRMREQQIPAERRPHFISQGIDRLVNLYVSWEKSDEAEKWRKELDTFKTKNKPKTDT